MDAELQKVIDEAALRRISEVYARGADRRDKDIWRSVMAPECTLFGPGFRFEGRDGCMTAIDSLNEMFRETQHRVFQQTVEIDGDTATGETYCSADHKMKDADEVWCWAIRYQNKWRREDDGRWLFTERELIVDWMEMRPLHVSEDYA